MNKQKPYDCVAEVRKIREAMSLKYYGNTELLLKDLKAARERFNAEQKLLREKRLKREQEKINSENKDVQLGL
ncbi:MAG: hypothetical protein JO154_01960 [Chitinophaga sp.]|uniref:hypothetical protein n=1 Tax=Chitinophaga sp. TaxID=1869181 RepID=UPI0025BC858A|nr:hypothetical protein [Chitinophaga sp.]MBV8251345.1 hypothetical protein [Chitinophaga sp.]